MNSKYAGINLLRNLIRNSLNERSEPNNVVAQNALKTIRSVVSNAQKFVDTTISGEHNKETINALNQSVDQMKKFIMSIEKTRVPWLQQINAVLSAAESLTKKTSFWARPKFLNVTQHVEDVQGLFSALRQAARAAYSKLIPSNS